MTRSTLRIPREVVTFHAVTSRNADWSSALAVRVNERLTKARAEQLASLVGYAWRQHMRGESLFGFRRHGHDVIVFDDADTTKTVRDDIGVAWDEFLEALPTIVREGSPVRTTDRRGPGTKGTRLVEGMGAGVEVVAFTDYVS